MRSSSLLVLLSAFGQLQAQANGIPPEKGSLGRSIEHVNLDKEAYIDSLISNMTVEDLGKLTQFETPVKLQD